MVILDSINGARFQLDLNIKVRNLRDILLSVVILEKFLKNSVDGMREAYSAVKGAFRASASI